MELGRRKVGKSSAMKIFRYIIRRKIMLIKITMLYILIVLISLCIYIIYNLFVYIIYIYLHILYIIQLFLKVAILQDFPGGTVDKNLPANAGYVGFIPGPGRFHTPQSN